jgi:hypothetical protein
MRKQIHTPAFLFLMTIFLFSAYGLSAQETTNKFKDLEIKLHSGLHLYTGDNLKEVLDNGYSAVEIRIGWSVPRKDNWTNFYNNPTYGVGVYSAAVGNPDILGSPNAVFGYVSFPIGKPDKHVFIIEPAAGITYDLKPHDPENNPLNDAIGSRAGVYFNLNIGAKLWLNREMDFTYGFDLTHFSNGRTFTPNYGLNMAGFNVGFRYHFNGAQNKIDRNFVPEKILAVRLVNLPVLSDTLVKGHGLNFFVAAGTTQNNDGIDRFFNSTVTVEYAYRHSLKHGYTLGLDLMYDGSLEYKYPETKDRFLLGIHPGYDFHFWRFDLRAQVGFYLFDTRGKGVFYLRPALRYWISDMIFAQVGLKTKDGAAADWVEYGLGIHLGK